MWLLLLRAGLTVLPFPLLQRLTGYGVGGSGGPSLAALAQDDRLDGRAERDAGAKVAWAIGVLAGRLPGRMTCLVQALAAHTLLRRRGCHPALRIGVAGRTDAGALKAHAWLECGGEIVVGGLPDLGNYAVLTAPARQ